MDLKHLPAGFEPDAKPCGTLLNLVELAIPEPPNRLQHRKHRFQSRRDVLGSYGADSLLFRYFSNSLHRNFAFASIAALPQSILDNLRVADFSRTVRLIVDFPAEPYVPSMSEVRT